MRGEGRLASPEAAGEPGPRSLENDSQSMARPRIEPGAARPARRVAGTVGPVYRRAQGSGVRALVEITSRGELRTWLEGRDRVDMVAMAVRGAARVLPLLATELEENEESARGDLFLPILRLDSALFAFVAELWHNSKYIDAAAATAAATTAAAAEARAAASATYATAITARAASANAAAAATRAIAVDATVAAADAAALEDVGSPLTLAARPLWPVEQPEEVAEHWQTLKAHLLSFPDEDWVVWTDWYEARLRGDPINWELEHAKARIPDEIWEQGPKAANAEIRRLIEEYSGKTKPDREALRQTASPEVFVVNGVADVRPNTTFETPEVDQELLDLPTAQRSAIEVLLAGVAENRNISGTVSVALKGYDRELAKRGMRPILLTLKSQYAVVYAEHRARSNDGAIDSDGFDQAFREFFKLHRKIVKHFPLDEEREDLYRAVPVDWSKLEPGEIRSLAEDFQVTVDGLAQDGVVTAELKSVSYAIAEDLKAATFVVPAAPSEAMTANRDLVDAFELSAADRSVIRAMTFGDSLIAALRSDEMKHRTKDDGRTISLGLLVNAISKALFG